MRLKTLSTMCGAVLICTIFAVPVAAAEAIAITVATDGSVVVMQLTDTIRKSVPFQVAADQAAADETTDDPTGFRLYINGKAIEEKTAAVAGCNTFPCSPTFSVAGGLAKGTYVLYMEAFNADGAAASSTLTLTVTAAPPKAPTNVRIIK